ncbi:MAG: TRAP transporter large permease subunit [Planctomycetota bacterium]
MLAGLFILLLALILIGASVIVALDLVALGGFLLNEEVSPVEFPKRMFTFLDSFGLLALPYFVLAGELLSRSGMSKKLVQLANALVGRWRGGLGQVSVLGCMAFGNVCGSAAAATAAIGGVLSPSMKEAGYKPGFTAAVIGCSGIIGSIIPPSMIMIVYGSMAQVSIGGLFLAGVLPGLLITALDDGRRSDLRQGRAGTGGSGRAVHGFNGRRCGTRRTRRVAPDRRPAPRVPRRMGRGHRTRHHPRRHLHRH